MTTTSVLSEHKTRARSSSPDIDARYAKYLELIHFVGGVVEVARRLYHTYQHS